MVCILGASWLVIGSWLLLRVFDGGMVGGLLRCELLSFSTLFGLREIEADFLKLV